MTYHAREIVAVIDGAESYSISPEALCEAKSPTEEGRILETLGRVGLNTSVDTYRVEDGVAIYNVRTQSRQFQSLTSL